MALTDEQALRASAWDVVFSDAASTDLVLDDMTAFANDLPETQVAGACRLLLYVLAKRGRLRREQRRGQKERART